MANEQNLIPLNKRAKSVQREIRSMGGKARAKKVREQKTYKELAEVFLSAENKDEELRELAKTFGIDTFDNKAMTLLGIIRAAGNGNVKAFDTLMELIGEKVSDKDENVIKRLDEVLAELDAVSKE